MKFESARSVRQWVDRQVRGLEWQEGERRTLACRVELDTYWMSAPAVEQFDFELTVQCQNGDAQPVEACYIPLEEAGKPARLRLDQPLRLDRLHIPKPWGQELWYTGVEQRGVCRLLAGEGESVPLPWVLGTVSPWLTGGRRELVLLKILDPLAADVWGDLYFELHEEKREVYVVTHVDSEAWPGGEGAIRFGFDSQRLAAYDSAQGFKSAYLASVAAYESIRREIDGLLDGLRLEHGIALDEPLASAQLRRWLESVPPGLLEQEQHLRAEMQAFTRLVPLRVGDVVKVPRYIPHALQHGVRTVEFQTPVYERRILSFAQKVLTQGHWDTAEAVELMALEQPEEEAFTLIHRAEGVLVERIVDFDDFEVERWRLDPGCSLDLATANSYALVMTIEGEILLGGISLVAEQASLVPGTMPCTAVQQCGGAAATVLVARPLGCVEWG